MYVIEGRNVNDNYPQLLKLIRREGEVHPSRAGQVAVLLAPVMLVTHRPQERVLFDPQREANPFFHLFESLFLLAGRDDYTWLDRFVRDFSARFAEQGGRGHGSYGRRWRSHFGFDQIDVIVEKLKKDPHDRRVVLSMWDPTSTHGIMEDVSGVGTFPDEEVHYAGANDLRGSFADHPCNTHIYPRIVDGRLDLTVCCRSNDAIWGATGANAVQFSMLQEYLAGRIGVGVGRLYQLANNMHAYTDRLARYGTPDHDRWAPNVYDTLGVTPAPIGTDWEAWDEDLARFMECADEHSDFLSETVRNPWFRTVAFPMWEVHKLFSEGYKGSALEEASAIWAPDWRVACENWIRRRMK